jgi:hypothetical protein
VDSDCFVSTFELVVEHIHGIVLAGGHRHQFAKPALEILLVLAKKTSSPLVDAVWINDLLKRAAWRKMDDGTFTILLRFSALRKGDDATIGSGTPSIYDYVHVQPDEADPQSPGGTVRPEGPTPEYTLLDLVLQTVKIRGEQDDGWQDDAVYGGLMTIRDIPGLQFCLPEPAFLETLSKVMEKWESKGGTEGESKGESQGESQGENEKGDESFRVRKAAYDVVLAARDGWLRSTNLRQTLEDLDFPRKLHGVAIEPLRSNHRCSFLEMMEILSEDRFWHSYLRKAMDIWLPLHHEGPRHALRILTNVGGLLLPGRGDYNIDKPLEKVLEDEWTAVPGRLPKDLTVDLLEPLAEVTEQFRKLFFTETDRSAVLAVVERVVPSLERRRDDGYDGPGDDIRRIIDNLLHPIEASPTNRCSWPAP